MIKLTTSNVILNLKKGYNKNLKSIQFGSFFKFCKFCKFNLGLSGNVWKSDGSFKQQSEIK